MDGRHAADLTLFGGHDLHFHRLSLSWLDRAQRPDKFSPRPLRGGRGRAHQTRATRHLIVNLNPVGSLAAVVPHHDSQHGRPPDLNLRRGDLLDRHPWALRALKLLAARLTGAAGRRYVSLSPVLRHGFAYRTGKIGISGIGRVQSRTGRHSFRPRLRVGIRSGSASGGLTGFLSVGLRGGKGVTIGRSGHEPGFAGWNYLPPAWDSCIPVCWRAFRHKANPQGGLTLRLFGGRRTHAAVAHHTPPADRIIAAWQVRIDGPRCLGRIGRRSLGQGAAAIRYATDSTYCHPAATRRNRFVGHGQWPSGPGRQLFQARKSGRDSVSLHGPPNEGAGLHDKPAFTTKNARQGEYQFRVGPSCE